MELVTNNIYRVAGVLSTASAKEIHRQSSKLKKYISVKKEVKSELDFSFFHKLPRTESSLQHAFSAIEHNKDKVFNSLFWFTKVNTFDDIAIAHLIAGEPQKALSVWIKSTKNKTITDTNISCFNNLSTLLICSETLTGESVTIPTGIKIKCDLINSPYFNYFVDSVADETFDTTEPAIEKLQLLVVDAIFQELSKSYNEKTLIHCFNECSQKIQDYISNKIVFPLISDIEKSIKDTIQVRRSTPGKAYLAAHSLYNNNTSRLSLLKSILGESNYNYKKIADDIVSEIIECDIINFNEFHEEKDTSNECYILMEYAKCIAISPSIKIKIEESIAHQTEHREQVLINQYIDPILEKTNEFSTTENSSLRAYDISSVSSYLNSCEILLRVVASEIGTSHQQYAAISSGVVNVALQRVILICNQAQDNNLDINRLSIIFNDAIIQINKLNNFYMSYETKQRFDENKPIIIRVSQAINENKKKSEGCYIATMAYGDYDHPQVIKLREFRDEILSKTKLGRWFIKFYYHHSPTLVKRLNGKPAINKITRNVLNLFIKAIQK